MKHPRASSWFNLSHRFRRKPDPQVLSWLIDQGSLTRRLMNDCDGRFSVRLLRQQWGKAQINEARLLGIAPRQRVLLREVELCCDQQVYVYARSLIPLKTLKGRHRRLYFLGERPLGGYLFAIPKLERKLQQLTSLSHYDSIFETVALSDDSQIATIWGRRSVFKIDRKPLLVSEFFLPALFQR